MRLNLKNIVDRHKNVPCVVTLHGPSLNLHKEQIVKAHDDNKVIRLSVNNWWDYFQTKPDYWILSTTEFTIGNHIDFLNSNNLTTFYSDDGDFTDKQFIEQNANFDWLAYDQRHWQGKDCIEILTEFRQHYRDNKNFKFKKFGNNEIMWHPPRCYHDSGHSSKDRRCCDMNFDKRVPIQEFLQNLTKTEQHYSTGDSIAVHAIAFAIIMGCNPIFVSGMDLDYRKGYANDSFNSGAERYATEAGAFTPLRQNFKNDLDILNSSAMNRGIEIINLCPDPWYDSLKIGKFL